MKKRVMRHSQADDTQPPWWDSNCQTAKGDKYRALDIFRETKKDEDLQKYKELKAHFKSTCSIKQNQHNDDVKNWGNMKNDTDVLCKELKKLRRPKQTNNSITGKEWNDHFQLLFNSSENTTVLDESVKNCIINHDNECDDCNLKTGNEMFNSPITISEAMNSVRIQSLKIAWT